jgi:hypothetical protein
MDLDTCREIFRREKLELSLSLTTNNYTIIAEM